MSLRREYPLPAIRCKGLSAPEDTFGTISFARDTTQGHNGEHAEGRPRVTIDIATADAETFRPYVGETFTVRSTMGAIDLRLDNVKIFEGSTVRDKEVVVEDAVLPPRKAFALTFVGPLDPVLQSAAVTLSNPETGPLTLFLSPFRRDRDCMLYESVFN